MSNLNHDKNVWLIWSNHKGDIEIYYLPEHMLDGEAYDVLHLCHNHFITTWSDTSDEAALDTLSKWLGKDGKFAHCKVLTETHPPETKKPTKVIVSGV